MEPKLIAERHQQTHPTNATNDQDRMAKKVGRMLGISLPDHAIVTIEDSYFTEKGSSIRGPLIKATAMDIEGTEYVVEIDSEGKIFRSTYCGEGTKTTKHIKRSCEDFSRVEQGGSVSPDKLAKARAFILGTDKPKAK